MTTLRITGNSIEALRFLEYARTLPFIEEDKRFSSLPHTSEELHEAVLRAEQDVKAGRTYTMDQVRARFPRV